MELLNCKVSYSNQLRFTEDQAISFSSKFTAAALICVGKKSPFQGAAMFTALFFKTNMLNYLDCITSEGWKIHQIANFSRSGNHVLYFAGNFILSLLKGS